MKNYLRSIPASKETVLIFGSGLAVILFLAILFYDQPLAMIFLSPYLLIWYQEQSARLTKKRKNQMKKETKEFMQSLVNCLVAGYSIEKSIGAVRRELGILYPDRKSLIVPELEVMERKLEMNQPVEKAFEEFAKNTDNDDLIQFSYVLRTAKRRGGNLIQVLRKTIDTIAGKNQVEEEITTILAGRVLEKNVMKCVPMFLIGYMRIFNPTYLEVLYTTWVGRIVMTVSLVIMVIAGKLADKITEIEV